MTLVYLQVKENKTFEFHDFELSSFFFFVTQVDRSVTGLVAQQQCVGYLHTPLADVAVTALSYFDTVCMMHTFSF